MPGVKVGSDIKEGYLAEEEVTAIPFWRYHFPGEGSAGIFVANGFGKLTGYTQVEER
ncbi:MAG: P1 family peptidase [Bacteroidales bacterium]